MALGRRRSARWTRASGGPRLRFCAPGHSVEAFYAEYQVLYGSGDFHYLTALFLRRQTAPVEVIAFDNHPDWDRRPPRWACGGWVNRALELPAVNSVSVWGCGNFELNWPHRLFGNQRDVRAGRLAIHAWEERYGPGAGGWQTINRSTWREAFSARVAAWHGRNVYVTIDLDCLAAAFVEVDWETGLFTSDDLVWALRELRSKCNLVGGDLCGARSERRYARWTQKFASEFDHPRRAEDYQPTGENRAVLYELWPALTGP
jgi:hypothetical protein